MTHKLLIANRGEIAIRIINAAYELDMVTVSIYSEDDANALHIKKSDEAYPLSGTGAAAYLDIPQIINIAKQAGCNYLHPGYGFLSENAQFAKACKEAGINFVGPSAEILTLFGNKIKAREFAQKEDIPTIPGTYKATTLKEAKTFFASLPQGAKMMIKSLAGGGGRGMGIVDKIEEVQTVYQRCQNEASKAFGSAEIYVEKYLPLARHIEVQILGDGKAITHLWERECSIQRRHQKLIEIAPCPHLTPNVRDNVINAAVHLAKTIKYENAGTFEFLVESNVFSGTPPFYFLEVNPRIQVEHTVTEEITGVDIVRFQLLQALGDSLEKQGLTQSKIPTPKGIAIQARINTESIDEQGETKLRTGQLTTFEMPYGTGVRIETAGYKGYSNSPNFDTLLTKLIVHSSSNDFQKAIQKLYRKLCETRIEGIETNLSFLQNILQHPQFQNNQFYTKFIEDNLVELIPEQEHHKFYFLADKVTSVQREKETVLPEDWIAVKTPMPGSVLKVEIKVGDVVELSLIHI